MEEAAIEYAPVMSAQQLTERRKREEEKVALFVNDIHVSQVFSHLLENSRVNFTIFLIFECSKIPLRESVRH